MPFNLRTSNNLKASAYRIIEAKSLQPWVDITRATKLPAGTMVVYWPFAWGATMAARSVTVSPARLFLILSRGFLGATLSHSALINSQGAGCIWNDILDRDLDAKVERTKDRPVVSGKIRVWGASVFLFIHIAIMLALIWDTAPLAWMIGLITIFPLAGFYPLMKRVTHWPQAWLGVAINMGIFMAWACITDSCPPSAWVLSMGAWCWTMWYDTIYACQDMKDDVKAGVKSTALLFGSKIKDVITVFGICFLVALIVSGSLNNQSWIFFLISVIGGGLHLFWQLNTVKLGSPQSCGRTFHANGFYFGTIVELGLLLDYAYSIGILLMYSAGAFADTKSTVRQGSSKS